MSEFDIMQSAAAGMDAERAALDLAARNVAAAEADGTRFERLVPRFGLGSNAGANSPQGWEPPEDTGGPDESAASDAPEQGVPIRFLGSKAEPGTTVDAVTEMVAVLDAQRAYEANASVFDLGKRLAERTIDMGRVG